MLHFFTNTVSSLSLSKSDKTCQLNVKVFLGHCPSHEVITRFDYYGFKDLICSCGAWMLQYNLQITRILFVLIMPLTLAVMFRFQVLVQVIVGSSSLVFAALLCNLHKNLRLDCKWPSSCAGFGSVKKFRHFYLKAVWNDCSS